MKQGEFLQNLQRPRIDARLQELRERAKTGLDPAAPDEIVSIYTIAGVDRQICGGPHAKNTAELGKFKIVKEESSSSGVRRIKAVLQ